ncbi:hypothetical protein BH23ACT5_BH23ACT5_06400 [soil metagenome]
MARFQPHASRREVRPTSLPLLVRLAAVALAFATIAASGLAWVGIDVLEVASDLAPTVSAAAEPTDDLLAATGQAIAEVKTSMILVRSITDNVADSTGDVADVVEGIAELAIGPIPDSLVALRASMPALIDTAAVIDESMRTLAAFGVPYSPEAPLDAALADVQAELVGLPESIAAQGETLALTLPQIRQTGADTTALSRQIETIEGNLVEIETSIETYRSSVAEVTDLAAVATRFARALPLARAAVIVMALAGLGLAVAGWSVAARLPRRL